MKGNDSSNIAEEKLAGLKKYIQELEESEQPKIYLKQVELSNKNMNDKDISDEEQEGEVSDILRTSNIVRQVRQAVLIKLCLKQ